MYYRNLDAFDAFLEEVVHELERDDEGYDAEDNLEELKGWLAES